MQENEVQHVFLVGAKSLGAYGGYETFINKLTEYHQNNKKIKYDGANLQKPLKYTNAIHPDMTEAG